MDILLHEGCQFCMLPLNKCQAAGADPRAETVVVNQLGKRLPSSSGLRDQETGSKK